MKESIIKYNKEKDGFFIKVQMIAGDSHEKKKFDCFLRVMDFWHRGIQLHICHRWEILSNGNYVL